MYELEFNDKINYLHVLAHGELNPETDVSIDAEIRQECENRNLDSAVIDIRQMVSRLTGVENHNAAKTFKDRMGPSIRAIAIIDYEKYTEKSEMFQLTATNRDANVRFFVTEKQAENWISVDRKPFPSFTVDKSADDTIRQKDYRKVDLKRQLLWFIVTFGMVFLLLKFLTV